MALVEHLLNLEKRFWTDGSDFYQKHLDDRCLMAFGKMAGEMSKDEVVGTVNDRLRWQEPEIAVKGVIEPIENLAILTYEARATRWNGQPYSAVVSSGYVKRDGKWLLSFHQQTPM